MRVLQFPRFLPQGERDGLFAEICANEGAFQRPGIPGYQQGQSLHLSSEFDKHDKHPCPVLSAFECLTTRIEQMLPDMFTALDLEPFPVPQIRFDLVNGLDGHSGLPHADDSGGRFQISILYYLHRAPRQFQGGQLQIYSGDAAATTSAADIPVAEIEPEDNLLLVFPSEVIHGVSTVKCDSEDFADGRFVAVAFLGSL